MQCAARMLAAVRQGIPLEPRCAGEELVFWSLGLDGSEWEMWRECVLQDEDITCLMGGADFVMQSFHESMRFSDYSRPKDYFLEFGCLQQPLLDMGKVIQN